MRTKKLTTKPKQRSQNKSRSFSSCSSTMTLRTGRHIPPQWGDAFRNFSHKNISKTKWDIEYDVKLKAIWAFIYDEFVRQLKSSKVITISNPTSRQIKNAIQTKMNEEYPNTIPLEIELITNSIITSITKALSAW